MKTRTKLAAMLGAGALIFAVAGIALADGSVPWTGMGVTDGAPNTILCGDNADFGQAGKDNPDNLTLDPNNYLVWLLSPAANVTSASLTISGDGAANGTYTGVKTGNNYQFVTPSFSPLDSSVVTVSASYVGSIDDSTKLKVSHGCTNAPETSELSSTIYSDAENTIVVSDADPGFAPVTVHDTATITFSGGGSLPAGSSVQFSFWNNHDCSGNPADTSDQIDATGSSPAFVDGAAFAQGPLAAGEYSFRADFTSGDENVLDSATGDCEPFVVLTQSTQGTTTSGTTTFPESSTFGNTTDPTDHSWMLIAALGVFLGSLLVLAPARAKSRR